MIKKLFLSSILFVIAAAAQCQTATEWQNDLRHLQQKVHTKYSNLFYNISDADWNKSADSFYNAIPAMNNQQVLAGFVKLTALFHVGHTQMNTFSLHGNGSNALSLHRYPFQLYWFSDGVYIIKTENKYANAVGGKLLQIGKLKTEDAISALRPLVSYENEQGFRSNVVYFFATPEFLHTQGIAASADEVPLTFIKNGKEETIIFNPAEADHHFSMTGLETAAGWTDAKKQNEIPL